MAVAERGIVVNFNGATVWGGGRSGRGAEGRERERERERERKFVLWPSALKLSNALLQRRPV
jgi:hypothetical protein